MASQPLSDFCGVGGVEGVEEERRADYEVEADCKGVCGGVCGGV